MIQSSKRSAGVTSKALANFLSVEGRGSTRVPASIWPMVLWATPVNSESSVWVSPAPRRSLFSFCPVVATVGIISAFPSLRRRSHSDLSVLSVLRLLIKRNLRRLKRMYSTIRNGRITIRIKRGEADVGKQSNETFRPNDPRWERTCA